MRKQYLKIWVIIIALVCLLRIHPTFAADPTPVAATDTGTWVTEALNAILKFLSFGWMLLAFLAGKLMSNDFIYGTFIHLDSALFKMWNYMKNIANFMLGFLFLFGILKSFFTKDAFELKKVLPRYLIAGIIIQMSWFIMGAFVDLANIATAAVGAFPQEFIQGSTDKLSKSKMMELAVTVPKQIDVSFEPSKPLFKVYTWTQTIEQMFGKFNDMSGPLMFMGASIFRFQDYDITNADISSWKNFSIWLFIKLFLLVVFCVPLIALIVINLIRIFRLWLWITFSPLAAIAWSFDDKSVPGVVKTTGEKLGFGKLSDVLSLIFQPVAMIGALSLVMILSIGMYYVLGGDPGDQKAGGDFEKTIEKVQFTAKGEKSTLKDLNTGTEITVDGDLFKDVGNFVGGMIGYLIITGFTAILIWSLIKVGASFSKFTKDAAGNVFKWSEKLVTNANIVPIGGGTSLAALKETKNETLRSLTSGAYANEKVRAQTEKLTSGFYKTDLGKATKNIFGINESERYDIDNVDRSEISQAATGGVNTALSALRKALTGKKVTAQSKNFQEAVGALLNSSNPAFKNFALQSTGITNEQYEANKANILNPNNEIGQKMLKFIAYVANNDVKDGATINAEKINEYVLSNMKTKDLQATSPIMLNKASTSEQK